MGDANDTRLFFAVALSLCALGLLAPCLAVAGVLAGEPESYMAGAPLAVFSPTLAAIVAARREGGMAAVRDVFRGLRAWRAAPIWWLLAFTLPALVYGVARAAYGLTPRAADLPWYFLPERPEQIAGLFLVPLGEEIGWRGYALPRLIARHGARRATLVMSLLWALWHVPMFVAVGDSPLGVAVSLAFIAVGNVSFTWLYRRGGGSLLLAVAYHFGAHLDASTHALPADATPVTIHTAGFAVLGVALLLLDRRAWEGRTPEAPGTPSARA